MDLLLRLLLGLYLVVTSFRRVWLGLDIWVLLVDCLILLFVLLIVVVCLLL